MNSSALALLSQFDPRQFEVPNVSPSKLDVVADGKHKIGATDSGYSIYSTIKNGNISYSIEDPDGKPIDGIVFDRKMFATGDNLQVQRQGWVCWEDPVRLQSICVRGVLL